MTELPAFPNRTEVCRSGGHASCAPRPSIMAPCATHSPPTGKPKLLDHVRAVLRVKHYSLRTEEAYVNWIRRFILFHGKRHPAQMGEPEIDAFLSHLALDGDVAASTQNQALNAIVFLYKQVLKL